MEFFLLNKTRFFFLLGFFMLFPVNGNSQSQHIDNKLNVLFYNVENLFDTSDDSLKRDEEFLPDGARHWSAKKYTKKINHLYKTILASGEWEPPALVGLCEVENEKVLNRLVYTSPLSKLEYRSVHYESPDFRGIDVALLYRNDIFHPVFSKPISIYFEGHPEIKTRDILYVKGVFPFNNDTLHIFVNHWPSRRGGQLESEYKRKKVASVLRKEVDSLFNVEQDPSILIMGDFNDKPENISIMRVLNAKSLRDTLVPSEIYNLAETAENRSGSYKYQGIWQQLDQIIVSGGLLNENSSLYVDPDSFTVLRSSFLLIEDEKYLGNKPFSTFHGFKYKGGFSDHLPLKVRLVLSKQ